MNRKDKAPYVQDMFSAIARTYDLLNTWLSFGMDASWRRFAVERCGLRPGDLVLDVATGTAELARQMLLKNPGIEIVGLDFNVDMLAQARAKRAKLRHGERIRLIRGDALRLPFRDGTFGCATIGYALRNVTDVAGAFREMARVVKPGGRVVSLELTRPTPRIVRWFYYLYLFRIAPFIGGIISGRREAYTYLPESIVEFPSPEEVAGIMRSAGMEEVVTYRLTFGSATVHVGVK